MPAIRNRGRGRPRGKRGGDGIGRLTRQRNLINAGRDRIGSQETPANSAENRELVRDVDRLVNSKGRERLSESVEHEIQEGATHFKVSVRLSVSPYIIYDWPPII